MARRQTLDQIVKILMMIVCLVAIIGLRHACSQGVVNLFNTLAPPPPGAAGPDAGPPPVRP